MMKGIPEILNADENCFNEKEKKKLECLHNVQLYIYSDTPSYAQDFPTDYIYL